MKTDCEHFLILKNQLRRCELRYKLDEHCGNACSQYRPERVPATEDTAFRWGETIGIGFLKEKAEDEDFLLLPTIGIGFAKNEMFRAIGIGLKFGFWALVIAIKLKRKPSQ